METAPLSYCTYFHSYTHLYFKYLAKFYVVTEKQNMYALNKFGRTSEFVMLTMIKNAVSKNNNFQIRTVHLDNSKILFIHQLNIVFKTSH